MFCSPELVLLTSPVLMQLVQGLNCERECEDTAFAWLHYIQNKSADSEVSQGRFFIGRAKWSLLRKKKVGGSHALLQHSDSLAAEHRQM